MTDTNVTLTKIANLIQEQSVLGNQINKLSEELPESFSWEKAVGVLPQGISFVAVRNKETKDWFTADNYRFIFKRSWTTESDRSIMFPVGLVDLDSKAVIVFDLGDVKEDTHKTRNRGVTPFYPGFYIRKDIAIGIYAYPQYSVNVDIPYTWFHSRDKDKYEFVEPSNLHQIEEIGMPVIGYIPFDKIDSPARNSYFEFYQAY